MVVCVLTFIKLGMSITTHDPEVPLLVTFDLYQGTALQRSSQSGHLVWLRLGPGALALPTRDAVTRGSAREGLYFSARG